MAEVERCEKKLEWNQQTDVMFCCGPAKPGFRPPAELGLYTVLIYLRVIDATEWLSCGNRYPSWWMFVSFIEGGRVTQGGEQNDGSSSQ